MVLERRETNESKWIDLPLQEILTKNVKVQINFEKLSSIILKEIPKEFDQYDDFGTSFCESK